LTTTSTTTSKRDPFSVEGKHIVVIGGTAGIGLAVAAHLAATGAEVVITGRRAEGEAAAAEAGASFVRMDVADTGSVRSGFDEIAEAYGQIDCLVLNAGIDAFHGEIDELDLDTFERVLEVNTIGLVRAMASGVPLLQTGSSVVITSSPAGSTTTPGMGAYSASKAALDMLVRTWALELGPKGIRVNSILPGIVESEMDSESSPELELIRRMTATGVHRAAAEMGPVFQFLASDASAPLTGSAVGAHDGISVGFSHEVMRYLSAGLDDQGSE
jgi:NAD(P)-dependent dehydrogenase (short-subunit alcohol dehydrogenase family)